jgi:hypothetical protein
MIASGDLLHAGSAKPALQKTQLRIIKAPVLTGAF